MNLMMPRLSCLAMLVATMTLRLGAQQWDAAAEFSGTINPSGAWTYGYWGDGVHPWGSGNFTPYALSFQYPEAGLWFWANRYHQGDKRPSVECNTTDHVIRVDGAYDLAAGQMALHSGQTSPERFTALRWTAPGSTGRPNNYSVNAIFLRLGEGAGEVTVWVLVNGTPVASPVTFNQGGWTHFEGTYRLSGGGRIEFVVGPGGDGYANDIVALDVRVRSEPGPQTISGHIDLLQYTGARAGLQVVLQALDVLDPTVVVAETIAYLDQSGDYLAELMWDRPCHLRAKCARFLASKRLDVDLSTPAVVDFILANGDANGDNLVGLADLSQIMVNFSRTDAPGSDLDGSGKVELLDLNIVLGNFGRIGD